MNDREQERREKAVAWLRDGQRSDQEEEDNEALNQEGDIGIESADLGMAYLAGHRSRDEEVAVLTDSYERKLAEFAEANDTLRGMPMAADAEIERLQRVSDESQVAIDALWLELREAREAIRILCAPIEPGSPILSFAAVQAALGKKP